jgi:Ca2+-binding EF-hand superfamily protein
VIIQEYDIDRSGALDKLEFEEMISKLGIFMTTQELTAVYNQFDRNRDGQISYQEFINAIKVKWKQIFNGNG